jgi:hypothetical protein
MQKPLNHKGLKIYKKSKGKVFLVQVMEALRVVRD